MTSPPPRERAGGARLRREPSAGPQNGGMPFAPSDVPALVPYLEGFLVDWIDQQRRSHGVPGIQVALRQGEELLFSRAVGLADAETEEPLTTAHAFRIASHSKTFTATAVLRLLRDGRLRLDDPVAQHVPELAEAPIGATTLRSLLGHQAGAARDGREAGFWQREREFPDRDELLAELRRDRVFPANAHFHYSNLGYSLLGLVIEAVEERPYADAMRTLIAELGDAMAEPVRIGPDLGNGEEAPIASGHGIPMTERGLPGSAVAPVIPPASARAEVAATGFWSNAETISAWMAGHTLGTGRFLDDDAKRLMQREESCIATGGSTRWYGLGVMIRKIGARRVIGHSGGFPGHITQTWTDPKTGLTVSVLTNRIDGPASGIAAGIIALLDKAAAEVEDADAAVLFPDAAGRYLSLWGDTNLVCLPGVVLQLDDAAADPAGQAVVLRERDGVLRAEAEDGFGGAGEPVLLHRDSAGVVEAITVTGNRLRRPPHFGDAVATMLAR